MTAADAAAPAEADGPGLEEPAPGAAEAVREALDAVEDPHIPASLVELEMVVDVAVDDGRARVELTYPCLGCPAYGMIQDDVRQAATSVPGVDEAEVEVVWDPVWSKSDLSDDVREKVQRWGVGL
jgi:metal-sulfur cluster biosynthetic enzyme